MCLSVNDTFIKVKDSVNTLQKTEEQYSRENKSKNT